MDFSGCSGSKKFAREMAAASPFPDLDAAVRAARDIWFNKVDVNGWLESFAAHPEIGVTSSSISQWCREEQSAALATATHSALQELVEWNAKYREKFGFVFLICASGRSTPEILAEVKKRYTNKPIIELEIAAQEEMKIIELRLAKLFEVGARPTPSVTTQLPVSHSNKPGEIRLDMTTRQRETSTFAPKIKAHWTPEHHKLFVCLCLDQIAAGNKPGTCLNKKGWKYVMDEFYGRTGLRYDKKQFKNHWDSTKDQWKVWNKLKSNMIEGGWDPNNQTICISDEWWTDYLQMHPEAAQFRYKGLPLTDLLDALFSGVTTSGSVTWTPSNGTFTNVEMAAPQETQNLETNHGHHEVILEEHAQNQESPSFSQGNFDNEPPTQRRRILHDPPNLICQQRITRLDRSLHHPCEIVESRSSATSAPREEYSIKHCVDLLNEMSEIQQGSELYMFALDVFLKKEYRELFIALGMPKVRFAWLRRQEEHVGS